MLHISLDNEVRENYMKELRLIGDIDNNQYIRFINYAVKKCDSFSITKFKDIKYDCSIDNALLELTQVNDSKAKYNKLINYRSGLKILEFLINDKSKKYLISVNGLYEWKAPLYYEDLTFYKNQKIWLRSITHEKIAFINIEFKEDINYLQNELNIYFSGS